MGLDELKHHALDVSNNQVRAGWRGAGFLNRRCARRAQMRGVLGKRVDDERRAEVSERADILFWPSNDNQATENRDFNPLFVDLETFSDRLTRECLVPLDGGFDVTCKDRHARAEHLHSTALSLSNTPSCVRTTVPEG